jgi:hypothetical protein
MTTILTYMPQELPQSSKHKRAVERGPKERCKLSPAKVRHNLNTLDKSNNKNTGHYSSKTEKQKQKQSLNDLFRTYGGKGFLIEGGMNKPLNGA